MTIDREPVPPEVYEGVDFEALNRRLAELRSEIKEAWQQTTGARPILIPDADDILANRDLLSALAEAAKAHGREVWFMNLHGRPFYVDGMQTWIGPAVDA